jgi:hypothetical protein
MSQKASVAAAPLTRNRTVIWLIGQPEKNLPNTVLPTMGDIMRTFFYYHRILKQTIPESAKSTSADLVQIWDKARVPSTYQPHIVSKLKTCVDEYNLIKKNKGRTSDSQSARETEFKAKMHVLFDIAHKDAETLIKIDEDKLFLEDQRNARIMKMSGVDVRLSQKEKRTVQRRQVETERKQREEERKRARTTLEPSSSHRAPDSESENVQSESEENVDKNDHDFEIQIPVYHKNPRSKTVETGESSNIKKTGILEDIISSPGVSSTLDRINLSDRKFTLLAAAIAKANGQDIQNAPLSRSTVRRKRMEHRSSTESRIRQDFLSSEKPPMVVHWDGKIMHDSTNLQDPKSKVDRIAVGVTGLDIEKILGIIKIPSGTGQAQANATFQLLTIWEVIGDIVGMCFDTTASNTGSKNGACVLLEKLVERNLLYFACRHHTHEVVIAEIYSLLFEPSRGPNIALFERFQRCWPSINTANFAPLDDVRLAEPFLQQLRVEIGLFLQPYLSNETSYIPREDYKEMIELCLLVLGFPLPDDAKQYHFRLPGAYHMARWMAKVIYCMKIYLFRNQFKLTAHEMKSLSEFCMFAAHIYVPAWIACPVASDAPVNDLMLFRRISQYTVVNKVISQAALKKLQNHTWYLGSEMIPLSLFSSKVSDEEKKLIVEAMIRSGNNWSVRGIKCPVIKCDQWENKQLHELVTSSSTASLRSLGLDVAVLSNTDPQTWEEIPEFRDTKAVISSVKVVNDAAERSVALMSTFNQSITKTESEMQKLIQVVEDNRKRIPDSSKRTLMTQVPL